MDWPRARSIPSTAGTAGRVGAAAGVAGPAVTTPSCPSGRVVAGGTPSVAACAVASSGGGVMSPASEHPASTNVRRMRVAAADLTLQGPPAAQAHHTGRRTDRAAAVTDRNVCRSSRRAVVAAPRPRSRLWPPRSLSCQDHRKRARSPAGISPSVSELAEHWRSHVSSAPRAVSGKSRPHRSCPWPDPCRSRGASSGSCRAQPEAPRAGDRQPSRP